MSVPLPPGSRARGWARAALTLGVLLGAGCTGPVAPPDRTLMPAPSGDPLPSPTGDALQALLDGWVAGGNGDGVTAAVVSVDGTWAGASGVDGAGRPLVPESAMAVGGLTRTFVAAELLLLADAGRVDLDAPVTDYVTLPFDARDASLRQLLTMRSGFPLNPFERVLEPVAADLERSWTPDDLLAFVDPDGPRAGQLGGSPFDNDLNYVVLGMVIEEVTGEPLAQVLRRDLVEPAALPRVWFQDDEEPRPPRAVARADGDGEVDPDGPFLPSRAGASVAGAAGGLAADAPSIARWGYGLYGGHVLDADLVEQLTAGTRGTGYGMGTELLEVDGESFVGHTGGIPGFHGVLEVSPARSTAVAVLVPSSAGSHLGAGVDAVDLTLQLHRELARARL